MTDDSEDWAPVRFWLPPAWSWGFFVECLLLRLAITLGPPWLLMSVRQGIAALVMFVALSIWPWPRRLRATHDGLRIRYLFVETMIPIGDIERVSLERDHRRWLLGERQIVLRLQRRLGTPVLVFAAPETLRRLSAALRIRALGNDS